MGHRGEVEGRHAVKRLGLLRRCLRRHQIHHRPIVIAAAQGPELVGLVVETDAGLDVRAERVQRLGDHIAELAVVLGGEAGAGRRRRLAQRLGRLARVRALDQRLRGGRRLPFRLGFVGRLPPRRNVGIRGRRGLGYGRRRAEDVALPRPP